MKNLLFADHKVTNRSFRAQCSEIIQFHDVLTDLNLEDLLRTIKSLFINNTNTSNNNNNNFKPTIFYKKKILTKLN